MNLTYLIIIIGTVLISSFLVTIVKGAGKGIIAVVCIMINAALSSLIAIGVLQGKDFETHFLGGIVFGEVFIRVDALSAWFILVMNFTALTGILYGRTYMKPYENRSADMTLHYVSYLTNHVAMIGIYCIQHMLAFLCAWEIMALTSFMLIIFEHGKMSTLKAGINYLIQSHISISFLTLAFVWVSWHTSSYDFNTIAGYTSGIHPALSLLLFIFFFIAFAIKAGFVPFHTWLPYAHPAAPSHISGVMSGVIIKLGIFGILRMLLLIKVNFTLVGSIILIISTVSGVYGVILAIIQHNLKKLLAYHSIENIGIIGLGIGLGCLGLGANNSYLSLVGFGGALLHTLNHSLFKSLLFYSAGKIYQATHTVDIERLGGIIKKLPHTAFLFLIGSLAICGLPPFNGFISEFLLFSGLFDSLLTNPHSSSIILVSVIFGLSLIGGLALLCFTKAFGIIFLGTARQKYPEPLEENGPLQLFPLYLVAFFILFIGLAPQLFILLLRRPVLALTGIQNETVSSKSLIETMQIVGLCTLSFFGLSGLLFWLRQRLMAGRKNTISATWNCGYTAPTSRIQYTANSFVRSSRKLIRPLLMMNKSEGEISAVFPSPIHSYTHPYDKMEAILIDQPLKFLKRFMGRFDFLQNGSEQSYILYGVSFIIIAIIIPVIVDAVAYLLNLFNQV